MIEDIAALKTAELTPSSSSQTAINQTQIWKDIAIALSEIQMANLPEERLQQLTESICNNLKMLTATKKAFPFRAQTIGNLLKNLRNIPSAKSIEEITRSLNEYLNLMIPTSIMAIGDVDVIIIDEALNKIPLNTLASNQLKQIWYHRGSFIYHFNSRLKELILRKVDKQEPPDVLERKVAEKMYTGIDYAFNSINNKTSPPSSLVSTLCQSIQVFSLDHSIYKNILNQLVKVLSNDICKKRLRFAIDELIVIFRGLRGLCVESDTTHREVASYFNSIAYYVDRAYEQGVRYSTTSLPKVISGFKLFTGLSTSEKALIRSIIALHDPSIGNGNESFNNNGISQICGSLQNLEPTSPASQLIYKATTTYLKGATEEFQLDNWSIFHIVHFLKNISGSTPTELGLIQAVHQMLYRQRMNYPGQFKGRNIRMLTANALGGIAYGLRNFGTADADHAPDSSIRGLLTEVSCIFRQHEHILLTPESIVKFLYSVRLLTGTTASEKDLLNTVTRWLKMSIEHISPRQIQEFQNELTEAAFRTLYSKSLNVNEDALISNFMATLIKLLELCSREKVIRLTNSQLLYAAEGLKNMTGRYPQELFFINFYCDLMENRQEVVTNGNVVGSIAYSMRFMEGHTNIERRFFSVFSSLIETSKSKMKLENWALASVCSCIRSVTYISPEYTQLVETLVALIQSNHTSMLVAKDIPLALSGLRIRADEERSDDEKLFFNAVFDRLSSFASNSNVGLTAYEISDILHRVDNIAGTGSIEERQIISLIVNLTAPYSSAVKLSPLELSRAIEGLKAIFYNNSEEESLIYLILKYVTNSDVTAFESARQVGFVCSGLRNLSGSSTQVATLIDHLATIIENSSIDWREGKTVGIACFGLQSMSCDVGISTAQPTAEQRFVSAITRSISQSMAKHPINLSETDIAYSFIGMRSMSGKSPTETLYINLVNRFLRYHPSVVITSNRTLEDMFRGIANLENFSSSRELQKLLEHVISLIDRSLNSPNFYVAIVGYLFSDICFAMKNITNRTPIERAFIAKASELLNSARLDKEDLRIIPRHICRACFGLRNLTGETIEERKLLKAMLRYIHINRFFNITPDLMNLLLEGCAQLIDEHEEVRRLKTTIKEVFTEQIS